MSIVAFASWPEAKAFVRERDRPEYVRVGGCKYKVYPSGVALCTYTRPYHKFVGDRCDCRERKSGGTIATFRLRI